MEYKPKDGTVITDAMIEELGEAVERDGLPGKPGKFLVGSPGRPRISDEDLVTVAFKVPASKRDQLDRAAKARGQKRSEFLRDALEAVLALV